MDIIIYEEQLINKLNLKVEFSSINQHMRNMSQKFNWQTRRKKTEKGSNNAPTAKINRKILHTQYIQQ